MHIAPDMVRTEHLGDDVPPRRAKYLVRPVPRELQTCSGTVFRASRASAAIGERVLTEVVANLIDAVKIELEDAAWTASR